MFGGRNEEAPHVQPNNSNNFPIGLDLEKLFLRILIVFKIVWLELLTTPLSIHTSLLLGRLSIGCVLNTVTYSRLSYWCTSSHIVVIQNTLYLSLKLYIVFITCKSQADGVFLEVPHFATSVYKSFKHFGLSSAYDAPRIWNDLPDDYVRPLFSTHSERSLKPISSISALISTFPGVSPWP